MAVHSLHSNLTPTPYDDNEVTTAIPTLSENEKWLLSFYRISEISGSLFFGRLVKLLNSSQNQINMTKHFADEAQHAWLWTHCLEQIGAKPYKLHDSYQDQYASAVGAPANLMEVLAITQVFEKRVIRQYTRHLKIPSLHPLITKTLQTISEDEKWHIQWVRDALKKMEPLYGADHIQATLHRFTEADKVIYQKIVEEHQERVSSFFKK